MTATGKASRLTRTTVESLYAYESVVVMHSVGVLFQLRLLVSDIRISLKGAGVLCTSMESAGSGIPI